MKPKRRWNERTRLILTLELAVVLPAAALVMLSVWHLNQIRRDRAVEAAIQRDFTQVLHISEKQINYKAFALADDVRNDFPTPGEACAYNLARDAELFHAASRFLVCGRGVSLWTCTLPSKNAPSSMAMRGV